MAAVEGWTPGLYEYPAPPVNVQVLTMYKPGILDVRWDNPAIYPKNTKFSVVGVNVYRSDVSDRGPFFRINAFPQGGTFYRDVTNLALVENEVVDWNTSWLSRGEEANSRRWAFQVRQRPIVKHFTTFDAVPADSAVDVLLSINGEAVPVGGVFGPTGEVWLVNIGSYDAVTDAWKGPPLPGPDTEVKITYRTVTNRVSTSLDAKIWYRLTTLALDSSSPSGYIETPLEYTQAITPLAVESMDYIWREAVRRNNWILEQGGERVKVFKKKTSGHPCFCCRDPKTLTWSKQADSRCHICWGTSFIGGYDGPWDMIVAPDDAERRIESTPAGRYVEHMYEVWTGPSPLLTQFDLIVKETGERYSIGPVRKPTNRGNIMQQHFQIRLLDDNDLRYQIPMFDPTALLWPGARTRPAIMQNGQWEFEYPKAGPFPEGTEPQAYPGTTDKDLIPDERQQRGRTIKWENGMYAWVVWWCLSETNAAISWIL